MSEEQKADMTEMERSVLKELAVGYRVLLSTDEGERAAESLVRKGLVRRSGGAYVATLPAVGNF